MYVFVTLFVHPKHTEPPSTSLSGTPAQKFGKFSRPVLSRFQYSSVEFMTDGVNLIQQLDVECAVRGLLAKAPDRLIG